MKLEDVANSDIQELKLIADKIFKRMSIGVQSTRMFGRGSSEFGDYKIYNQGESTKHIDWKLYARSDKAYIRQTVLDTGIHMMMLLDTSASMGYRFDPAMATKFEVGLVIAKILSLVAEKQGDSLGLLAFNEGVTKFFPPKSKRSYYFHILKEIEKLKPEKKTFLPSILNTLLETYNRKGMILVISDLHCDIDPVLKTLAMLDRAGFEILLFHVLDEAEKEFPFDGWKEFQDLETGESIQVKATEIKERYKEQAFSHIQYINDRCKDNNISFFHLTSSMNITDIVAYYLHRKLSMQSKGR